jgi:hypothetical protein
MIGKAALPGALVVLVTLALASIAGASTTVRVGDLVLVIDGKVTPKALPKKTLAPIALDVEGAISKADGSHPPALTEVIVDTDKNGSVDARGVPTCKQSQLEAQTTAAAERVCRPAIVGTGTTDVEVEFAEQRPIPVRSKLVVFNGGIQGATTTIFIHAYLTNPVSAGIVTTLKIKKQHNGRYGTRTVASIPKIGGDGSVTGFNITFVRRLFSYKGHKHGYLVAKCPDGHFDFQVAANFANGDQLGPAKIVRGCTPKG